MHKRFDPDLLMYFERADNWAYTQLGLKQLNISCIFAAFAECEVSELYEFLKTMNIDNKNFIKSLMKLMKKNQKTDDRKKSSLLNKSKNDNSKTEIKKDTKGKKRYRLKYLNLDKEIDYFNIDKELYDILVKAAEIANSDKKGSVITEHNFCEAFATLMPTSVVQICSAFDLLRFDIKDYFLAGKLVVNQPYDDDEDDKDEGKYFENISDKIDITRECMIVGRDEELDRIWTILGKEEKANAIITGNAGSGKTALIEKMAYLIKVGKCPEQFKGYKVYSLNVNALISGTKYRGQAEKRFEVVKKMITSNEKIIIFIDEIHTIMGAGSVEDNCLDFSNSLKVALTDKNSKVIGATTNEEYENIKNNEAINRRFENLQLEEPNEKKVFQILEMRAKLQKCQIKISKESIKKCIYFATCFENRKSEPDRSIDFYNNLISIAKRLKKDEVDTQCFERVMKENFDNYALISETNKRRCAVHEAAHYVVTRMCSETYKALVAVLIIPCKDYLGANIFRAKTKKECLNFVGSYDEYLSEIASLLAGRIGQNINELPNDSGVFSDYTEATKMAEDMVVKFGLDKSGKIQRVYSYLGASDNGRGCVVSEKDVNYINNLMNDILSEAKEKAEKILKDEKEFYDMVVNELLDKGICSSEDLEQIYEKTHKNKCAQDANVKDTK